MTSGFVKVATTSTTYGHWSASITGAVILADAYDGATRSQPTSFAFDVPYANYLPASHYQGSIVSDRESSYGGTEEAERLSKIAAGECLHDGETLDLITTATDKIEVMCIKCLAVIRVVALD